MRRNIVVVSDLHAGCRLGLCPIGGVDLDDGGTYQPSFVQQKVYGWWRYFWDEWVPRTTHNEPYDVVLNGDGLDGQHHGTKTQISQNHTDQLRIALQLLEPIVARCKELGGNYYHIRGTEAHVGKSAEHEEALAAALGAVPNDVGQHARWELWLQIGPNNDLVHFTHHIGTTSSAQHETSAINAELSYALTEAGRWGWEAPKILVRSHRHRSAEVRLPDRTSYRVAFVTAAWQLKTPFTYRLAGARQSQPQLGGSLIRCGDEEVHTRHFIVPIERSTPE